MNIFKTVEPLATAVMLCSRVENVEEYFAFLLNTRLQVAKNLGFLQLSDTCRQEALFIVTVFTDELVLLKFPGWKLLQLSEYATNRGGEEFYDRLEATKKRYEENGQDEDIALLELYSMLLALGFTGKYWNDKTNRIGSIRMELNKLLAVNNNIQLVNNITNIPKFKRLRYIDLKSLCMIIVIILGTVLVALIFNDFAESHQELWQNISSHMNVGDKK